jgi:hypothetical protein
VALSAVPLKDEPGVVAERLVLRRAASGLGAGVAETAIAVTAPAACARSERGEAAQEHAQGLHESVGRGSLADKARSAEGPVQDDGVGQTSAIGRAAHKRRQC